MRLTLSALLIAGVSFQAAASELDYRYYLTPALSYVKMDRGRLVEDGGEFSINFGRALSDKYNYEIHAYYGMADNKTAGGGETDSYGLGVGLLNFIDRGRSPIYSLARLQWMAHSGHPGEEPDGPGIEGGLGLWFDTGRSGALRIEAGLRLSIHGEETAGAGSVAAGGKTIYSDGVLRIGYAFALGAEPAPVEPEPKPVEVVEIETSDSDGDGVIDDRDLCPGTAAGAEVDATGCTVASFFQPAPKATKKKAGPSDYGYPCRKPVPGEEVDALGCAIEKAVVLNQVNFEFDSAILKQKSKAVLDDVALALGASPGARIEIAGHTSLEGDELYNIGLSQRRAAAVKDYLVSQGVAAERLSIAGYGSIRPIASNESSTGRKENRRVEVKLLQDN